MASSTDKQTTFSSVEDCIEQHPGTELTNHENFADLPVLEDNGDGNTVDSMTLTCLYTSAEEGAVYVATRALSTETPNKVGYSETLHVINRPLTEVEQIILNNCDTNPRDVKSTSDLAGIFFASDDDYDEQMVSRWTSSYTILESDAGCLIEYRGTTYFYSPADVIVDTQSISDEVDRVMA